MLANHQRVEPKRLVPIEFCSAHSATLQPHYDRTLLAGVVGFHGSPIPSRPEDAKNIEAKALILHGPEDQFAPAEQITPSTK